ncbi:hypothetical protein QFC22_002094 [Naganishia vaughanmartiniae]|uniref:Uncharacterized protein n=1 Tax=Naganishia vaughanmartiniae TaxID=1424756 RepID=A0ACC2XBR9_9TREE|nr:hypothetical protein QFC22_002094 [Naganishia vaughanmartiniae]
MPGQGVDTAGGFATEKPAYQKLQPYKARDEECKGYLLPDSTDREGRQSVDSAQRSQRSADDLSSGAPGPDYVPENVHGSSGDLGSTPITRQDVHNRFKGLRAAQWGRSGWRGGKSNHKSGRAGSRWFRPSLVPSGCNASLASGLNKLGKLLGRSTAHSSKCGTHDTASRGFSTSMLQSKKARSRRTNRSGAGRVAHHPSNPARRAVNFNWKRLPRIGGSTAHARKKLTAYGLARDRLEGLMDAEQAICTCAETRTKPIKALKKDELLDELTVKWQNWNHLRDTCEGTGMVLDVTENEKIEVHRQVIDSALKDAFQAQVDQTNCCTCTGVVVQCDIAREILRIVHAEKERWQGQKPDSEIA